MNELSDAYGDAWASRDADAIAAYHADDGIFQLHADSEPVRGLLRQLSTKFRGGSR